MWSPKDLLSLLNFGDLIQAILPSEDPRLDQLLCILGGLTVVGGIFGYFLFGSLAITNNQRFSAFSTDAKNIAIFGAIVFVIGAVMGIPYWKENLSKKKAQNQQRQTATDAFKRSNDERSPVRDRIQHESVEYSDGSIDMKVERTFESDDPEQVDTNVENEELEDEE